MSADPRLFLSARRPSGQDDADPAILDALSKAASDPHLARWAEGEKEFDAKVAGKLRDTSIPAGLRERIVAGARVSAKPWQAWFEKRVWRSFRNSELIAVAAVALLLIVAVVYQSARGDVEPANWKEAAAVHVAAIEDAGSTGPLDHVVGDFPAIRQFLADQTCPAPTALPAPVQKLTIFGCAKRQWRGKPLSIVCFAFDGIREVHLVTMSRGDLPDAPPEKIPQFATVRGYETASWSEGAVAMMLIGKVQRTELEAIFRPVVAWMPPARVLLASER